MTITEQLLDLAEPVRDAPGAPGRKIPGFTGQGWSTHETMLVVRWLFAHPDAWDQVMAVARAEPDNPHTVADTLHEHIVPRSELDAIAAQGFDPAKVNWLEIAHELIERRSDPRPAQEHAGDADGITLAAAATVTPEAMNDPGLPVPDDKTAISMFTAHRTDDALHQLAHATERMTAARAASGELRRYHSAHIARHLQAALDAGHDLVANVREHYPVEAAELEQVKQSVGLANRGYELNPRSGMISLDLPPGTITPVPGGVDDHHITVVYLGPDVDDKAFAAACERARESAAAMPGPLTGTIGGIGSFKPSGSSDGKVPAWAGVVLPGAERLRDSLEDLSASEHKDWKPHVTLAYVDAGKPLPAPVPETPVKFTHLSVHRGDHEVARFPLGGKPHGIAYTNTAVGAQVIGLVTAAERTQLAELAKSVSEDAKAATTAHLLETTLHELTHGSRHAQAMAEDPEPDGSEWAFNADHAEKHLGGAVEHAAKLAAHFRDNYPHVARWLAELDEIAGDAEEGDGKQHARYAKGKRPKTLATISAQALEEAGTISAQVDLAEVAVRPFQRVVQLPGGPRAEDVRAHTENRAGAQQMRDLAQRVSQVHGPVPAQHIRNAANAYQLGDYPTAATELTAAGNRVADDVGQGFGAGDTLGELSGHLNEVNSAAGPGGMPQGWIPEPKWLQGQQEWKDKGEAAWEAEGAAGRKSAEAKDAQADAAQAAEGGGGGGIPEGITPAPQGAAAAAPEASAVPAPDQAGLRDQLLSVLRSNGVDTTDPVQVNAMLTAALHPPDDLSPEQAQQAKNVVKGLTPAHMNALLALGHQMKMYSSQEIAKLRTEFQAAQALADSEETSKSNMRMIAHIAFAVAGIFFAALVNMLHLPVPDIAQAAILLLPNVAQEAVDRVKKLATISGQALEMAGA